MTNVVDLTTKKAIEEPKADGPTIQEQMLADASTKNYQGLIVLGQEANEKGKIHFYAGGGTPPEMLWMLFSAALRLLESQNDYE